MHPTTSMNEALVAMKPHLNSRAQNIGQIIEEGRINLEIIQNKITNLKTSRNSVIESIDKEVQTLISVLKKEQRRLKESVLQETDQQVSGTLIIVNLIVLL